MAAFAWVTSDTGCSVDATGFRKDHKRKADSRTNAGFRNWIHTQDPWFLFLLYTDSRCRESTNCRSEMNWGSNGNAAQHRCHPNGYTRGRRHLPEQRKRKQQWRAMLRGLAFSFSFPFEKKASAKFDTLRPVRVVLFPPVRKRYWTGLASRTQRRSAAIEPFVAAFLLADRKGHRPNMALCKSPLRAGLQAPSGGRFLCDGTPTCKSAHP